MKIIVFLMTMVGSLMLAGFATAQSYTCKRTSISTNGFSSLSAAKSWYPSHFDFTIEGDNVVSKQYGQAEVERKGNKLQAYFLTNKHGYKMRVVFFSKTNRYSMVLDTPGGYQNTAGSRGKCQQL